MPLEDLLYPFLKSYTSAPQWVKSTLGSVYAMIPSRLKYGSAYARFYSEAVCTDEQTLRALIEQKLSDTLTRAIQTVPAYEEYRSLLATSTCPLELLHQIRPITKEMIKNQPDRFVSSSFAAHHRMPMFTGLYRATDALLLAEACHATERIGLRGHMDEVLGRQPTGHHAGPARENCTHGWQTERSTVDV